MSKNYELRSCFCVGPQNGQPLCPCQMRSVEVVGGRYVRTEDLGPVNREPKLECWTCKCGSVHYAKPKFCSECGALA